MVVHNGLCKLIKRVCDEPLGSLESKYKQSDAALVSANINGGILIMVYLRWLLVANLIFWNYLEPLLFHCKELISYFILCVIVFNIHDFLVTVL